jgi:hypothetical protein
MIFYFIYSFYYFMVCGIGRAEKHTLPHEGWQRSGMESLSPRLAEARHETVNMDLASPACPSSGGRHSVFTKT